MSPRLVRLLVRRDGAVFCTRRDDGRLDLPTRAVAADDPDGSRTVTRLAGDVLGAHARLLPVGFVRNIVTAPGEDYPWPVPSAHFVVWRADGVPRAEGVWVDVHDDALRDRHWWPLVATELA